MDIKTNKGVGSCKWPESREWAEIKPTQGCWPSRKYPHLPSINEEKSI